MANHSHALSGPYLTPFVSVAPAAVERGQGTRLELTKHYIDNIFRTDALRYHKCMYQVIMNLKHA